MKELELYNAYNKCLVDDEDYEKFNGLKLYVRPTGYVRFTMNNKRHFIHRFILNVSKEMFVDHKDGNPLNNQKSNLRICSKEFNNKNVKINSKNISGYKGVHFSKNNRKWRANISFNNKIIYLGYFETPERAAQAYDEASKKYHDEFGVTNLELKERKPIEILWKPTKFDDPNLKPGMVPLGHGKYAYVDLDDYERVMKHSWCLTKDKYAQSTINKKSIKLHRFIMNCYDDKIVDHIDHNTLNNKKKNLRICTILQNSYNTKYRKHSSCFKGVQKVNNKWRCVLRKNGQLINLGTFISEIQAAKIYDKYALKYFGEYAQLNFPKQGEIK